ncbi:MAG: TonB-dependent receptor [Myxococcota bacterium]|nr:TonB-dependent receptor [Myxococcota bacterium]
MYLFSTPLKSLLLVVFSLSIVAVITPLSSIAQDAAERAPQSTEHPADEPAPQSTEHPADEPAPQSTEHPADEPADDDLFAEDPDDDLFAKPERGEPGEGEEKEPRFAVPDDVETIQITGQKSDASQQGQAIAITSFNQEALDQLGVSNVSTLQQNVPSLHIGQTGTQGIITLRGVGIENLTISGEPGVLFVQDGVPIGSPTAALAAFYDVSALDVLRGPQGTQGGKHVSGGWISVNSAKPSPDFAAFGDYQIGTYSQDIFRGVLNTPIFDEKLMFRFTMRFEDREGYQRAIGTKFDGGFPRPNVPFHKSNWWGDEHSLSVRAQLLSEVTDRLEIHLIGMHSSSENNGPAIHLLSAPGTFADLGCLVNIGCVNNQGPAGPLTSADPRATTRDHPGALAIVQEFATAKATYEISSEQLGELEASFQYGFNRTATDVIFDFDETNAAASVIDLENRTDQHTIEVKLQTVEQRPWEWVVGAFWWQETRFADQLVDVSGQGFAGDARNINDLETDSIAGFGELSYWVSDAFRILFGVRYAEDNKDVTSEPFRFVLSGTSPEGITRLTGQWTGFTPKILMQWRWSDSNSVSVNATRGFKAGGFPLGTRCAVDAAGNSPCDPYNAEGVWQYELTSKNDFFDERLRLNLTLFWTDYDPYQVCFVAGVSFRCFDTGTATVRGFELEWTAIPIPELMISGNFNLLDARVDNFRIVDPTISLFDPATGVRNPLAGFPQDLSGNTLPKSPKYNLTLNAQYDIHVSTLGLPEWGTLTPRIQYNFQSRTYYRIHNEDVSSQGRFSKIDVRLTWRSNSNRWQVEGFVNNVTDVDTINSIFLSANFDGSITAQYQLPRTAGVRFKFSY